MNNSVSQNSSTLKTRSRPIQYLKSVVTLGLLDAILQLVFSTYVSEKKCEEVTLLYKNRHNFITMKDSYLANAANFGNKQLPEYNYSLLNFGPTTNDYSMCKIWTEDIEIFKYDFDEFSLKIFDYIFLQILPRITLQYKSKKSKNGLFVISEDREQHKENTKLCFIVIELVSAWAFKVAITNYYLRSEEAKNKLVLNDIQKNVELLFENILLFHPTITKYLGKINNIEERLSRSIAFNNNIRKIQHDIIIKKLLLNLNKILVNFSSENNNIIRAIKNYPQCLNLFARYRNIYSMFRLMFEQGSEIRQNALMIQFAQYEKYASNLLQTFLKRYKELELYEKQNNNAKNENFKPIFVFLEVCIFNLRDFPSFKSLIPKCLIYYKQCAELKEALADIIVKCFKKSLKMVKQHTNKVVLVKDFITDSYVWEMAKVINTDSKLSKIVANTIIEELRRENSVYSKLLKKYYPSFPGLLKSICDRTAKYMSQNQILTTVSARAVIEKLLQEEYGIDILMALYFAIKKETTSRTNLNFYIARLLQELQREGIKRTLDLGKQAKSIKVINMLYAIHILQYGDLLYQPDCESVSTKFRTVLYFNGREFCSKIKCNKCLKLNK